MGQGTWGIDEYDGMAEDEAEEKYDRIEPKKEPKTVRELMAEAVRNYNMIRYERGGW